MPFFSALGLGMAIIVLKVLTPVIFTELQTTAVMMLHGAQVSIAGATQLAAAVSQIPTSQVPTLVR